MKYFTITIFLLFCAAFVQTQNLRTISGKVYDSTANQPIQGATVQWLNEKDRLISATISNSKGYFELKIKEDACKGKL